MKLNHPKAGLQTITTLCQTSGRSKPRGLSYTRSRRASIEVHCTAKVEGVPVVAGRRQRC